MIAKNLGKLTLIACCVNPLSVAFAQSSLTQPTLTLKTNNIAPRVGEKFQLKVILYYKKLEDYEILTPHFEHFVLREIDDEEHQAKDGSWIDTVKYEARAKEAGTFTLKPVEAKIEILSASYKNFDNKSQYTTKKTISSNALTLTPLALSQNITVVGNYRLHATIDRNTTAANKPILYTLKLFGEGNIDNFKDMMPTIAHATLYEKESQVFKEKKEVEKKFAIVAQENYTIPSLSIRYFNPKTDKIVTTRTQPFVIHVNNKNKKEELSMTEKSLYFLAGGTTFFALFVLFVLLKKLRNQQKAPSRIEKLKKINNPEEFFKKVVPLLGKSKALDRLIYRLEEVKDGEFKKLKKELLKELATL